MVENPVDRLRDCVSLPRNENLDLTLVPSSQLSDNLQGTTRLRPRLGIYQPEEVLLGRTEGKLQTFY